MPPVERALARGRLTASYTPTSVRFTTDSTMCSGSIDRWSVSTPEVKKPCSAAASKMPKLPAAANAKMYLAPCVVPGPARAPCCVAGSFQPFAQREVERGVRLDRLHALLEAHVPAPDERQVERADRADHVRCGVALVLAAREEAEDRAEQVGALVLLEDEARGRWRAVPVRSLR